MSPHEQTLLASVQQHQRAGEIAQAEILCAQIVRDHPDYAESWNLLGILSFRTGKVEVALGCFERALTIAPTVAGFHSNRGTVLQSIGRRNEAEAEFREALRLSPTLADAHNNLGNILGELGRFEEAEACFRRTLELNPNSADGHNNFAALLWKLGRVEESAASCRRALELKPASPDVHNNLGNALRAALGRTAEAEMSYRRCLELRPNYPEAFNNLGNVLCDLARHEEAVECYRRTLQFQPGNAEAQNNLGAALRGLGRLAEAETNCRRALEMRPDYPEAYNNLGNVFLDLNRFEESETFHRRAVELKPNSAESHNNLGNVLARQGRFAESEVAYLPPLQLKPAFAEALSNLGATLWDLGRRAEATERYRQALELKPHYAEAHNNFAMLLLGSGDFEHGWLEYEWRWQFKEVRLPVHPQPLWDGAALDGRTILIHAEQGLGDTLQFIRYAALVKERGATVIFHCPRPLLDVVRTCPGIDQLVPLGTAPPPFDVHIPLLSLPRLLGTTVDTIPAPIPYLAADPTLVDYWRAQLAALPGFKVGIVWQGATQYRKDRQRSVPLSLFEPLARVDGVNLCSLQVGFGQEQLGNESGVTDLGSRFDPTSFRDAAAVVMNLDLVIAVDTSLVHLAGALGKPVWVALPFTPDWRWLLERGDSPWYPTAWLFRQTRPGDWSGVFAQMAQAVIQETAS